MPLALGAWTPTVLLLIRAPPLQHPRPNTHCLFTCSPSFGHSHSWCFPGFAWGLPPCRPLVSITGMQLNSAVFLPGLPWDSLSPLSTPMAKQAPRPSSAEQHYYTHQTLRALPETTRFLGFLALLPCFSNSKPPPPRSEVSMSHCHMHSPLGTFRKSELGGHRTLTWDPAGGSSFSSAPIIHDTMRKEYCLETQCLKHDPFPDRG